MWSFSESILQSWTASEILTLAKWMPIHKQMLVKCSTADAGTCWCLQTPGKPCEWCLVSFVLLCRCVYVQTLLFCVICLYIFPVEFSGNYTESVNLNHNFEYNGFILNDFYLTSILMFSFTVCYVEFIFVTFFLDLLCSKDKRKLNPFSPKKSIRTESSL